ncbi:MAG TPA: BACON domain-containing carbohydrate-binding protein [Candidatus Angelobacter sp.]|nr:BACON domain-containing carbohydrate-binding protein [Candidatus Angelobacter sp.]
MSACLSGVTGIAIDSQGNIFLADPSRDLIHRIDVVTGVISIVAGSLGQFSFSGDGGPATSAGLGGPEGIAVDGSGNLFIADTLSQRIRRVDAASGIITTITGTGVAGFNGDAIPAINAQLNFPVAVAIDAGGNLFIADYDNELLRRVDAVTGEIQSIANALPVGVAADSGGNAYFTDEITSTVQRFDAKTLGVTTVAGIGTPGFNGDGVPASSASLSLSSISGIFVTATGSVDVADTNNFRVREFDAQSVKITTVVGNGTPGDGGKATVASLGIPEDVVSDSAGNLFIADQQNQRVRRVDASTGVITTVAGGAPSGIFGCTASCGDGGPATGATLIPQGVALDGFGNLYIADLARVRRVDSASGIISTVAGTGTPGFSGDDAPALGATLSLNIQIAIDPGGNLVIADTTNNRIRKVDATTGIITTVVGNGFASFNGDGIAATSASLGFPSAVKVDAVGNIFVADTFNERIRRIDAATGIISTVAGNGLFGFLNSNGDAGPATAALLGEPEGLVLDGQGNLFIADFGSRDLRRVDSLTGIITTIAGDDSCCFGGDGGSATSAVLGGPRGLTIDGTGNLFFADALNNRIREVANAANPFGGGCGISLAPANLTFTSDGGLGSILLHTGAGCSWQLGFNASWLTPFSPMLSPGGGPPSGVGSRTVTFQVAANPGTSRTGTITLGASVLHITEQGAGPSLNCTFSINPSHAAIDNVGGDLRVIVSTSSGCQWISSSNASWLTITSGASGSGPGAVSIHAGVNGGSARTGTVTISGITYTVSQGAGACGAIELTSSQVRVSQGNLAPTFDPGIPNSYTEKITVTNQSGAVLHGPLFLALVGIPNHQLDPYRTDVFGADATVCFSSPRTDAMFQITTGDVAPGGFVSITPVFIKDLGAALSFMPKVLEGEPTR